MSQFINSIREVKKNYKSYDGWEQSQLDDAAKRDYLSKNTSITPEASNLNKSKTEVVLRAADILDKRSEDNCENMERSIGIISLLVLTPLTFLPALLMKKIPKLAKSNNANIVSNLLMLTAFIGMALWGNSKQKDASRLGRFQAKQHELKDIKNFVVYSPEQIEAAKNLVKNMPTKKDVKGISEPFKKLKQMSLDKKEYKKWLQEKINTPDDVQKLLNTEFSKEQIEQGDNDKEIIVNIVKDINIEAEKYSENVENVYDTMAMLSTLIGLPVAVVLNKILSLFKEIPQYYKKAIGPAVGILLPLYFIMSGTSAQKEASRVGRYKKKKEIMKNPNSIVKYTDEQFNQAKDIKAPVLKKGFFNKIGNNLKFFVEYNKDKKEYIEYKKTHYKENEKLYEALNKTDVSEKQLKDAKYLQEKTFMTFDKIDEMSQRYSEDTETATDIAKQIFSTGWSLGFLGATVLFINSVQKGKFPLHKVIQKISNLTLDKNSELRGLINKGYEIIKSNKELKSDFNKLIFNSKARKRFMQNEQLAKIFEEFLSKIGEDLSGSITKENPAEAIKKIASKHFKQDAVSKWFRNLVSDISKLWLNGKFKKAEISTPDQLKFDLFSNFKNTYKNYKTLLISSAAAAIPLLGLILGIPYAIGSWLTNIQKKAGKIGIMKAMQEIDNPKLYVNKENAQDDTKTKIENNYSLLKRVASAV